MERSMLLSFSCLLLLALAKPTDQVVHGSRSLNSFLEKNIFVLAGQSNMSGRGGVVNQTWDKIVPPECQPNPSILRLNSRLRWEQAREPLHFDIDVTQTCGIGPGMSFANTIRHLNSSIGIVGLVPCAVGGYHGTKISEWAKGTLLYKQLIKRTKSSVKKGGKIRAILWFQGESDTVALEDAEMYSKKLKALIMNLRADLQLPMLPFIQVALASGQGHFLGTVRKSQLDLNLPNVRCVDAFGVPLSTDYVHLTTQAEVRVGKMLAEAFYSFNSA
ncbi:hypothetical protein MKW94_029995 [Papaver nudicaule]|uniref:Sialate O-acetylesterase domain-containing protein n=1 Tax=Papaver nudicaule TaxID=74823 RepID=A0AA41SHS0_PAPNU|nr:hypothetical protein [Papaver nudicaule]